MYIIIGTLAEMHGGFHSWKGKPGEGVLPIMDYTRRLRPKRGTLFRMEEYKRVGISRAEILL